MHWLPAFILSFSVSILGLCSVVTWEGGEVGDKTTKNPVEVHSHHVQRNPRAYF